MMKKMKANRLGTMPINKLVLTISAPMMVSMLVQSLYNVADSIFVAQISEEALTALSLAYPIQMLMIAIQVGTGVGTNAELSKQLGSDERGLASKAANNSVFLGFVHYLIFLVFGLTLARPFFQSQTNNPQVIEYGMEYTVLITTLSIGKFMQFTYERILQATGRTFPTMLTQGLGAILNIILDPILIFGWFGMPALGVLGAAIATVIAQCTSAIMAFIINAKMNDDVDMHYFSFRPDFSVIKRIYSVGIPSMVMTSIVSIVSFLFNSILTQFSETAIAVYGIYVRLQGFAFMPIFGLDNGMVPIISYNYGAKKKQRVTKAIKVCFAYGISLLSIVTILFQVFPEQLLLLFNASNEMLLIGIPSLRIISLSFAFAGIGIMTASVCQALGNGMLALLIQIIRQLVVLIPVAYLLSLTGNLENVWWSKLISELAAAAVAIWALRSIYNRKIKDMQDETDLLNSEIDAESLTDNS